MIDGVGAGWPIRFHFEVQQEAIACRRRHGSTGRKRDTVVFESILKTMQTGAKNGTAPLSRTRQNRADGAQVASSSPPQVESSTGDGRAPSARRRKQRSTELTEALYRMQPIDDLVLGPHHQVVRSFKARTVRGLLGPVVLVIPLGCLSPDGIE